MNIFTVVILICTVGSTPQTCSPSNARVVLQGPEVTNIMMCGMRPQAYLGQTAIAIDDGEFMKIVCRRTTKSD